MNRAVIHVKGDVPFTLVVDDEQVEDACSLICIAENKWYDTEYIRSTYTLYQYIKWYLTLNNIDFQSVRSFTYDLRREK